MQNKIIIFLILCFILSICFILCGMNKPKSFEANADDSELRIVNNNKLNEIK